MNRILFLTLAVLFAAPALASNDAAAQNGRAVRAGTTTSGSVVVFDGNLDVYGTVRGNATAVRGDVIVHRGGRVRGNATSVSGRVRVDGGVVDGRIKGFASSGRSVRVERPAANGHSTLRSIGLVASWVLVVALAGFALLAFGADKLTIVIDTMRRGVGKSLGSGLIGQLAILPGAVSVMVLLAASLIGILLIPLGLVTFMFLVAGIGMFGFVAAAIMTGAAITGGKSRDATPHGAMLRAFVTGTAAYLGLWILAAALSGIPLIGAMAMSFAAAVTFVAATTGFGAVLLSWWQGAFKRAPATVV